MVAFSHAACFFALVAAASMAQTDSTSFTQLNEAFQSQVWIDDSLWDDTDSELAKRMALPKESETKYDRSFRSYPKKETQILGSRPYSIVLYSTNNTVDMISIVFINKGDYPGLKKDPPEELSSSEKRDWNKRREENLGRFHKEFAEESQKMETRLNTLLGASKRMNFGKSKEVRERVDRWDWKGHSILLSAQEGEYLSVRILPTELADAGGKSQELRDTALRERLKSNVERRPNGDVILSEMPMVNQGQKGYCVPATLERVMRYLGMRADMYTLAMAGNTDEGGGTRVSILLSNIQTEVERNGRKFAAGPSSLSVRSVATAIDDGLPLLWTVAYHGDYYHKTISQYTSERKKVADAAAWKERTKAWSKETKDTPRKGDEHHMCMIIGYNKETGEIAFSDSWGGSYAERWIPEEDAQAIDNGGLHLIRW